MTKPLTVHTMKIDNLKELVMRFITDEEMLGFLSRLEAGEDADAITDDVITLTVQRHLQEIGILPKDTDVQIPNRPGVTVH